MVTRKLGLGPNELKLLFTLEKNEKTVFTSTDAHKILRSTDASVKNILYRLRKKRRIDEIEKGKYLLVPAKAGYEGSWSELPLLLAPHLIAPYYIGFWTALNYWGMTEQVPNTVFVATTKRKRDLKYGPTTFEFVTLARRRFFGFVEEQAGGGRFHISSREKTILDCLLYPRYCGGLDEAVKGIWNARDDLDFAKLTSLAARLGVSVVIRRLGYVLEVLSIGSDAAARIASRRFTGFLWLDPLGPRAAPAYSKKYGLAINRTKAELTSWMGH